MAEKQSTTTVSAPESSYKKKPIPIKTDLQKGTFDPKAANKRVEDAIKARKTNPTTPKAKTKETTKAPVKAPTTTDDSISKQLTRLQQEKQANSITTTSLGMPYQNASYENTINEGGQPIQRAEDPYAYAREGTRYPIGGDQGGTPVGQQGGQQGIAQPTAPLPPAQALPPDAPLWLKLIRGVLTPVPPLAMIPHMFIQGMQAKRAAAQAEDDKNMEYFWDMYDRNPIAAAQLAKTPLFRDTLQRKHGFEAKDLDEISKAAAGQPYKSSELAQMTSSGVVDKTILQPGLQQGNRRLGLKEKDVKLGPNERLYSGEHQRILYDAKDQDFNTFYDMYKEANPGAKRFEALIAQQNIADKKDMVKWVLAGDRIIAVDNTKPFSSLKENENYFVLDSKNKGKAQITVAKNPYGGTIGFHILNPNVEDAKLVKDPETGEEKWEYPQSFISMEELLYGAIKNKYGDTPPPPDGIREEALSMFGRLMKAFSREVGLEGDSKARLEELVIQAVMERLQADRQASPGQSTSTTSSISDEVQSYIK